MVKAWTGRAVTQARDYMRTNTTWPATCGQCNKPVQLTDNWVVGHILARATHPEHTWNPDNWRIEHRKCSDRTGQATVIAKAKADALREHGITQNTAPDFFPHPGATEPPPLPFSLPVGSDDVERVPVHLRWDALVIAKHAWLAELVDVPEDSSPPLMMSAVHHESVCSFAWDGCTHLPEGARAAEPWIEENQRIGLRWWQRLSLRRQLEHRADGSLVYAKKVESAPRRAGKSVGLRGSALWRLEFGQSLFGEVQNVIHTGSDMNIVREIQRAAWRWCEDVAGWTVTRANGKECIETMAGDRWLARAQDGVYGYDLHYGMVDEAWDVKPDTVSEGLEPAMLERRSPQLVLTSTAHRRATSLMRAELASARSGDDPSVLFLLWAADPEAPGYDPGDERVWKAASPFWSEDRRRLIAGKYAKALAGEADKEFDDPDPMRGFEAQYLNVWRLKERRTVGVPIVSDEDWGLLRGEAPGEAPDVIAVESWFDSGVSVAKAWKPVVEGGPAVVSVDDYPSLKAAVAAVAASGCPRPALVGAALVADANARVWSDARVNATAKSQATRAVVADVSRMLNERAFLHDGSTELTEQVLAMRVSPGTDGPRIRSTERADALKAAAWAVSAARSLPVKKTVSSVIVIDW